MSNQERVGQKRADRDDTEHGREAPARGDPGRGDPAEEEGPGVPLRTLGGAVLGALAMLAVALVVGQGLAANVPGIDDPGPITAWGLPIAKLGMNLASVLTIGALLFAVLAPSDRGALPRVGERALRAASNAAWVWTVAAVLLLVFTVSDFAGSPPQETNYRGLISVLIVQTAQGRGLAVVVVLGVLVAATARAVRSLSGAALVLALAVVTAVPVPLTGHSSSAADHDIATSSLLVHVVVVTLWVGGLLGLVLFGRGLPGSQGSQSGLAVAARRYSGMALWFFVAAGLSGVVNAWVRLGVLEQLWQSRYGLLLIGKTLALLVLGWLGWQHRRRSLAELDSGRPGAFRRLALGEVVVMALTFGLAVALSRSPTPVPEESSVLTGAEALIGYEVPPFEPAYLLTMWRPDTLTLLAGLFALTMYVGGVRRLRAAGIAWSAGRTVAWFCGVVIGVLMFNSGVAAYGPAMFSVHMVQHMVLSMLVPILLAMGAPVTLALRALPARPERPGDRNARAWLLVVLHSRFLRIVTNPVVALALYIGTLYGFYFSPLFGWAMSTHELHMVMLVHFAAVGSVYFWPIIGLDPMPRKLAPPGRMLLLVGSLPFHAFFGVIVMMSTTVIGAEWYSRLHWDWLDPLTDQNIAGGIAWGTSELPVLLVMLSVFVAWRRSDEREARRADRTGEAEWKAYNEKLAQLAERDG